MLNYFCVVFLVAWIPFLYFKLFPSWKLVGSADGRSVLQCNGRFKVIQKLLGLSLYQLLPYFWLQISSKFLHLLSQLTSYYFLSSKPFLLHGYHYIKNIICRPWTSCTLCGWLRHIEEKVKLFKNWGASERTGTRCLMQSDKIKPQSSEVFKKHAQESSCLNFP